MNQIFGSCVFFPIFSSALLLPDHSSGGTGSAACGAHAGQQLTRGARVVCRRPAAACAVLERGQKHARGRRRLACLARAARPRGPEPGKRPTRLGVARERARRGFFIFIFLFIKYICRFFFCKNVTQPPVHPAEGRYRRMNRQ